MFLFLFSKLYAVEDYRQCYGFMQELRKRIPNVNIGYYVNIKTIEAVHRALDIPLGRGQGPAQSNADEVQDELM